MGDGSTSAELKRLLEHELPFEVVVRSDIGAGRYRIAGMADRRRHVVCGIRGNILLGGLLRTLRTAQISLGRGAMCRLFCHPLRRLLRLGRACDNVATRVLAFVD